MVSIIRHLREISFLEEPLWTSDFLTGKDTRDLNMKEYQSMYPSESSTWFPMPMEEGIQIAASKTSGKVMMSSFILIRRLMNTEYWKDLFPCIIIDASMVPGGGSLGPPEINVDTKSARIEIKAEIQVLSPLVAVREMTFERNLYRLEGGGRGWLVVDTPIPVMKGSQLPYIRSCLVHPCSSHAGLSKVIWIEMIQYRSVEVHPWYRQAFWSRYWFWTLSRECARLVGHGHCFSPAVSIPHELVGGAILKTLKRLVILTKEMTTRFYSNFASATPRCLPVDDDANEHMSFSMGSISWTATKSFKVDVKHRKLLETVQSLDSLVGEKLMQIPFDRKLNCISLHLHNDHADKRMMRETCFDNFGGIVVTAELESNSLNNEDPVSSAITSVFGLIIHSDYKSSILTIGYVQPPSSSSQNHWKQELSQKIYNLTQHLEVQNLV